MNSEHRQLLETLDTAVEIGYRANGKAPTIALRYRTALIRFIAWQHKLLIAQNKVAHYESKVRYYEKRFSK